MNEDPTQNLPQPSFEERVLAALSAMHAELSAMRAELSAVHTEQSAIRTEQSAIRTELSAIRQDVATLGERMSALEEKVDRRLQETRPMWEGVQEQIRQLDRKFDVVLRDLYELRSDQMFLNRRVDQFEKERAQ